MRLVRIRRVSFDVLAVHEDGETQVVEKLQQIETSHPKIWSAAFAALYVEIPQIGPEGAATVKELCEPLCEFVFGRRPGVGFRVVWFFGNTPFDIVCSNAFVKGEKMSTPEEAIATARAHYDRYQSEPIKITDIEIGDLYDTH